MNGASGDTFDSELARLSWEARMSDAAYLRTDRPALTARPKLYVPPAKLDIIAAADWSGTPAPEREWLLDQWIPDHRATLLTGDGGSGKSLIAQQLATCAAAGAPFLGKPMRQCASLYITCEDDRGELQRRQEGINRALDLDMGALGSRLTFLSRVGQLRNSLVHFKGDNDFEHSDFFLSIVEHAATNDIRFVVLDNIAHLFEGNENIRNHVATFCNAMEGMAKKIGGAVLFLGHPPKSGAQFSGSTAWENQVRSRLWLSRPDPDDVSPNLNERVLKRSKSNYAAIGDAIEMQWQDWAFLSPNDHRLRPHENVFQSSRAGEENDRFLACLDESNDRKRSVSEKAPARNYAPRMFAKMPTAGGMKEAEFERAMERLFHLRAIETGELWRGADRHPVMGLRRAGQVRASAGQLSPNTAESGGIPCGPAISSNVRASCGSALEQSPQTPGTLGGSAAGQLLPNTPGSAAGEPPYRGAPPAAHPDPTAPESFDD